MKAGYHLIWWLPTVAICMLVLAGCDTSQPGPSTAQTATSPLTPSSAQVTVFAASSLKDAFTGIAQNLNATAPADKITYNFAGSQALAAQLDQRAEADVFASADEKTMQAAIAAGRVLSGTQRVMLTNRLIVIVPPGRAGKVRALKDLANPGVKLDLAAPSVPAGNYSLQIIDKLSADPQCGPDLKTKALANIVSREDNVRQVLTKVSLGEADAGIVYVTDARAASNENKLGTIEIEDRFNVIAHYYIAPIIGSHNSEGGRRFIEFVLSPQGQQTLQGFGFEAADQK